MADSFRDLEDGEVLFREGDVADCAYIVDSGQLEISTQSEAGTVALRTLQVGELVGEMGVIDASARTATATAIGSTRLMLVTRNQFTERIEQADPILRLLVKILLERYRSGLSSVKRRDHEHHEDLASSELVDDYIRHGLDKIRLEAELKDALESGQLKVLYQPILDVETRRIAGFEALARWEHPIRGHISPGLFIALAEETSLIVPVGLYVLEQACSDIAALQASADDKSPLFMSVNVSVRQVLDPAFLPQVSDVLRRRGLRPGQLRLEITEGLLIDLDRAAEWVSEAKSLGFKVALDDFGTGYSSLETIHKLDVDVAKIDRAFVVALADGKRSRDLMRGIVSMMKTLGLEIVVEGIETTRELEFIWALDCDYGQGYLIGKSLPVDEAKALLELGPVL